MFVFFKEEYNESLINKKTFIRSLKKCHLTEYFNIEINNSRIDKKEKLPLEIYDDVKVVIYYNNSAIIYLTDKKCNKYQFEMSG